ncbi:MAG: hypothetical protein OEV91_09905, partial [Desulfobulbaceae bacterium]|nr:hypothetical protein [Desulfobulbaceae bacterium]
LGGFFYGLGRNAGPFLFGEGGGVGDLTQVGFSAGGGGILGALFAFFGFRDRLDRQDKRMDQLEKDVVYRDTCAACKEAGKERDAALSARMDKFEKRNEELHKGTCEEIKKMVMGGR